VAWLRIEETEHLWKVERSPDDGAGVACYDHTEEMVWRHLNVFEQRCEIRCRLPRARCSTTQKIYQVCPPWEGLSKHFIKAFEAMALLLEREMPVAVVARHVKATDTRLWRMLRRHVEAAYPLADWNNVICVCAPSFTPPTISPHKPSYGRGWKLIPKAPRSLPCGWKPTSMRASPF
jgi:transposase